MSVNFLWTPKYIESNIRSDALYKRKISHLINEKIKITFHRIWRSNSSKVELGRALKLFVKPLIPLCLNFFMVSSEVLDFSLMHPHVIV